MTNTTRKPFDTWLELFDYVRSHSDDIYVRYQMNNETTWGPYPISKIPFIDVIGFLDKWFADGFVPSFFLRRTVDK